MIAHADLSGVPADTPLTPDVLVIVRLVESMSAADVRSGRIERPDLDVDIDLTSYRAG